MRTTQDASTVLDGPQAANRFIVLRRLWGGLARHRIARGGRAGSGAGHRAAHPRPRQWCACLSASPPGRRKTALLRGRGMARARAAAGPGFRKVITPRIPPLSVRDPEEIRVDQAAASSRLGHYPPLPLGLAILADEGGGLPHCPHRTCHESFCASSLDACRAPSSTSSLLSSVSRRSFPASTAPVACRHRNWSVKKIRGACGSGSRSEARQCEFALVV